MNRHHASEQRQESRFSVDLAAQISVGTQLTIQGRVKDLSLKSAFIVMKAGVYLQVHDEVGFAFQLSPTDEKPAVQGVARISRIVPGEGMAIYFTAVDDASLSRLKKLLV